MAKNPNRAGKGRRSKEDLDTEFWVKGDGLAQVRAWLREKRTDGEIARLIGIHPRTLLDWKKKFEVFGTLFDIERKVAIPHLLKHMYDTAIGYYRENEVIDGQGRKHKIKQWYPGNANAQQFLAKNWDREAYRDKWEIDLGGKLPIVLTSDETIPD